jgi:PAS domain S-box-containing protein
MLQRILLIDDNPNDRYLAARELNNKFANLIISEVTNEEQLEQELEAGNFDLAITDNKLLWTDGIIVVKVIKQKYPNCPVIMFTDSGNEEIAVEAMKAGLDDYVLKKQHYRRLAVAIEKCLEQKKIKQEYTANQKLLHEHQEKFRLAQDAANLGMWDWDLLTNIITWNENHEKLFGMTPGSFDGTYEKFIACVHPSDKNLINEALAFALENNTDFNQEFRVIWSDNTIHWIISKGHFFYNESNQAIRASGIVLDISDRKEREFTQQKYTEELLQAYNIQDEFLSIASHELRTPLNAILGWTQLLRKHSFDENTRNQRLEIIERNLKRQQNVVEQILDISRLKSGQMQLERTTVDLILLVEGVITSARLAVDAKLISLEFICNNSAIKVLGDKAKLHQAIWNLLSNAVKFTPYRGHIKLELGIAYIEGINIAQITVSDTGEGIRPEFIPYAFEQFRQQDASLTRAHQGAGLGLTIVKQIIEMHGGSVTAESQGVNKGATFTVQLPLLNTQANIETFEKENSVINNNDYSLKGLKILVVDDEEDTLDLLVTLLENEGAVVTAVDSATQALKILETNKPDVLISDLIMPDKDGYSLLEEAKTLGLHWNKPLKSVAISGYNTESKDKVIQAGFQASLSKPIEPDELVNIISLITSRLL